ncbi:MAG: phasin family protein [Pseudomonadota bacterium]
MPTTKTATPVPKPETPAIAAGMAVAMMPWSIGAHMATTWMEGVTRMNGEWARFVADRLKQDAETQHEVFTCGSPIEAQRLGAAFLRKSVEDYMTEAARISSMGLRVAKETGIES